LPGATITFQCCRTAKCANTRAIRGDRVYVLVRQKSGTALAELPEITVMNRPSDVPGFPSRVDQLLARARRAQQRGERRQALVALREATLLEESNPKLWALYAAACVKANRLEEAERAFGQALFFRQRAHDTGRAGALRRVIERLGLGRAA
ncbi:MAG TPA: hypothetical protein VIK01_13440, partial [Polyangiaceae bacterium]